MDPAQLSHSPGGGRALDLLGSNLPYTLGGFKVRFSGPAKLQRGVPVLPFAELCGLLCYLAGQSGLWQEKRRVVKLSPFLCAVKNEPCLPCSAWDLALPQAPELFSLCRLSQLTKQAFASAKKLG